MISPDVLAGISGQSSSSFTTADENQLSISSFILQIMHTAVNKLTQFLPLKQLMQKYSYVLNFSEAVDVKTGNIVIYNASNDSVVETIDVTSSQVTGTGSTQITINPGSDLAEQTSYYVNSCYCIR